jgi:hypothetical protein
MKVSGKVREGDQETAILLMLRIFSEASNHTAVHCGWTLSATAASV